ncbi:MAG: hypothetical protein AAGF26_18050 [Cyanobacteria bacterium P01_G01_bin.49]
MPTTVTVKATSPTNQLKSKAQEEQDFEQQYQNWLERQMLRYDDGAFYH